MLSSRRSNVWSRGSRYANITYRPGFDSAIPDMGGITLVTRAGHLQTTRSSHAPRPVLDDWNWQHHGRCLNLPSEVFFPDIGTRKDRRAHEERAKRICRDCPVIAECYDHAVRTPETHGIWAATTPRERAGSIAALHEGSTG